MGGRPPGGRVARGRWYGGLCGQFRSADGPGPEGADARLAEGLGARLGREPASVLCVPCHDDDVVVGALELVDKAGGVPFSFDDVELVTLLGGIAGPALRAAGGQAAARPPAEFATELAHLATSDPAAYARLSVVLEALLARG